MCSAHTHFALDPRDLVALSVSCVRQGAIVWLVEIYPNSLTDYVELGTSVHIIDPRQAMGCVPSEQSTPYQIRTQEAVPEPLRLSIVCRIAEQQFNACWRHGPQEVWQWLTKSFEVESQRSLVRLTSDSEWRDLAVSGRNYQIPS